MKEDMSLGGSVTRQIYDAAQVLLSAVHTPGVNIAARLNSTLNQFLTWPFRAGSACITDAQGHHATFDTVIYTGSEAQSERQPVKINADAAACAIHVADHLGQDELRAGYESIATLKRLGRTPTPEIEFPINSAPLGIIVAVESTMSMEEIAESMIRQNKNHPSTVWPDMVAVLTKGTVNYAVQVHGEPFKGDFVLPITKFSPAPPMYIHLFARGLGLFSMNRMCGLLFMHLHTFSPGTKLPTMNVVLEGVSPFGMTVGAYQFNLESELVPVPDEVYVGRKLPSLPFRIEDSNGTLLAHFEFIPWQDGGVIRLIGRLPLDGILVLVGPIAKNAKIFRQSEGAISSVLPIGQEEFRQLLYRIQTQTNMTVKAEKPKLVISKISDEGTTSPFVARLSLGILRLRDVVITDDKKREEFDNAYEFVFTTLFNARTTAKEIVETLGEHKRKVTTGETARLDGHIIRIDESIDSKLQNDVADFLNGAVRVVAGS